VFLLRISGWALQCPATFHTGFRNCQHTLNSKMLLSLKQHCLFPSWVSYFIMNFSRKPLWRWTCASCIRRANVLLCFSLSLLEYWPWQKGASLIRSANVLLCYSLSLLLEYWPWQKGLHEDENPTHYSQDMKTTNDSRESLTYCASNFENVSACLKWSYRFLCLKKYPSFFASFLTNTDSQPENIHVRYKRGEDLQYRPWKLSSIMLKIHIKGTG